VAEAVIIRMHVRDNVAIVGNDGGLPAGTPLPGGPTLREKVRRRTRWRSPTCRPAPR